MNGPPDRRIAPGIKQLLPLPYGYVSRARRNPIKFYTDAMRTFGDVFRYQVGPWVFHLLTHPDHVKHVLQDEQKNYPRSRIHNLLRLAVGDGVLHVAARAASCDEDGGEGAACHMHQQDWGVPVRVVEGGATQLVLPLSGRS